MQAGEFAWSARCLSKTIGGSFLNFWGEEPSKKTTFSWCFQQNSKPIERIRIVCRGFAMFSCGPWKVKTWKFPEFMEIPFKETDQFLGFHVPLKTQDQF